MSGIETLQTENWFSDSRRLLQTDQPFRTCLEVQNFRFHASMVQYSARITQNLSIGGCMNRNGKYRRKFDICSSAETHIPQMLRADSKMRYKRPV
ncbi:hypothetical protein T12_5399 [Trichinella patagoniensis]|uniref:Uncharacterized protein n=1 Tax=Trichinella patagoniensis TaxID=990121 RepID=A0A0V1ADT7_9BILA|nr:hypothetical protein T12_5399 [Trichinella patagoniensis]